MKKLFSLVCVALFTITASAQITWNVKGGVGVATCIGDDAVDLSSHIVGKIGVGIEKPLTSNWSLMPSLEVAWKGAEFNSKEAYESLNETLDMYYLQIPVVAAYRFNVSDHWNITLKTGPYLAYALYGQLKFDYEGHGEYSYSESGNENPFSSDNGCSRFDVGWDFGIDFECRRFVFGAEYEIGFMSFGPDNSNIKNSAAYFTLGYKF